MYRIELAPGEETVFRTIEELAIGVRNGLVTPRCRIYHNASQKWLPIEFHPHYKKALALPASRVAEAVAPKPAGRPRIDTVSFAVRPAVTRPGSAPVAEPTAERGGDRRVQARRDRAARSVRSGNGCPSGVRRRSGRGGAAGAVGGAASGRGAATGEQPGANRSRYERRATGHAACSRAASGRDAYSHGTAGGRAASCRHRTGPGASRPERQAADHPCEHGRSHRAQAASGAAATSITPSSCRRQTNSRRMMPPRSIRSRSIRSRSIRSRRTRSRLRRAPCPRCVITSWPAAKSRRARCWHRPRPRCTSRRPSQTPCRHHAPGPIVYRPDSYLPPSVRVVSDDPYVAIAPEAAIAPDAATETRGAIRSSAPMPWRSPVEAVAPELPSISYPEITPADEPVPERAGSSPWPASAPGGRGGAGARGRRLPREVVLLAGARQRFGACRGSGGSARAAR